MEKRIVYSANGEDFCFDDYCELRDWIASDAIAGCDYRYYEGEAVQKKASDYFCVIDMLDTMACRAYEDAGEYAEDFPNLNKEKTKELEKLIFDWLDANIEVNFWTVHNVQEKIMPAEDLM